MGRISSAIVVRIHSTHQILAEAEKHFICVKVPVRIIFAASWR